MTVPISEAQVSPAQQAKAPNNDRHIQDAVYCLEKSTGISPGPFSIIYSRANSAGTPPLQNTCTQFLCPPVYKQRSYKLLRGNKRLVAWRVRIREKLNNTMLISNH